MPRFRDCLTCGNLLNLTVRIPLATFLIHQFSHWLFNHERVLQLIRWFTTNPTFHFAGRAARDLATIQKMTKFWPPHQGSGYGEFSLAFTISLILFIRLIDMPTITESLLGRRHSSRILNFLLTPIYASIIPFVLLLPMMRLAEMHIFVLALNFLHLLVSSYVVYFVWYFLKKSEEIEEEKIKSD